MSTQILRAPDLLHQAELLKSNVIDENGDVEWQIRLELQRLLENALLIDLDYAVARQVEQMLWNFCFKNCIDAYQNKLRRRKIDSDVAQLQFFLDSCVGYFTQLLGRLSREFNLNLHCYKSDANLGILNGHFRLKKKAESSNLNHVAQFCLIHLGDIARYQKNIDEAESFYIHAWRMHPENGHAFNQLAILELSAGRQLSALSLYTRSLYVQSPFQAAAGNIDRFCDTIDSNETSSNFVSSFLRLFSALHSFRRLDEAEKITKSIFNSIMDACDKEEIDSIDLENMIVIIIGEIWRTISLNEDPGKAIGAAASRCTKTASEVDSSILSLDEYRCLRLLLDCFRAVTTATILFVGKKPDDDEQSLATLKVALDFVQAYPEICKLCCSRHEESIVRLLSALSSLLNQLQPSEDKKSAILREDRPLPEDVRLRGFLPLEKAHASLKFDDESTSGNEKELAKTRIDRLISFGKLLSQRLDDPELFSATLGVGEAWLFSAKKLEEKVDKTPSPELPGKSTIKRTKVVPLIMILEREKATGESPKPTTKTVRIKTPEPVVKEKTISPPVVVPEVHDVAPRFQAARLKQALTGEGKPDPGQAPPPLWDTSQRRQTPMEAWFQRPPLMMPPPHPPPPRPIGSSPLDVSVFHRTPGVRPPGPPPFPPPGFPPMATPAPWPPAPPVAPSLYLGRDQDPYFQAWDPGRHRRPLGLFGQPPRPVGDESWRNVEWSRSDGIREQPARAMSSSPFFGTGDDGTRRTPIGERPSQPEATQFSLFGIDSPWEYAGERLQGQGGKN